MASICCSPPEKELVDLAGIPAALARCANHAQVLVDRERREQPPPLRDVPHAGRGDDVRRLATHLGTGHSDRPVCLVAEAHDRVAERRLAHAVAADDGQHAMIEGERHALQHVGAPEMDVELLDLENRRGART
jgi:hypothetical protein